MIVFIFSLHFINFFFFHQRIIAIKILFVLYKTSPLILYFISLIKSQLLLIISDRFDSIPTSNKETESPKTPIRPTNKNSLILSSGDVEVETSTGDERNTPKNSEKTTENSIITLKRPQYYTIPALDMLERIKDDEGKCYIKGFTVGRVGYGNVCFPEIIDVSNLNLDEIVHIRHREVILYPDDSKKPPVGQGLNRHAQVTLDGVYPVVSGETIKKPDSTLVMYFTENLREVCERKGMRFLEYRPDTGSFVFEVDHFSKYGLDNEDISVDTSKYKNKQTDEKNTKSGLLTEIDADAYGDDDVVMNGLGGITVPDIEMTDIVTSSSESKEHSECERMLPDEYFSSLFDFPSNQFYDRAKEMHLMKSALYFDNIAEVEKDLGTTEEAVVPVASTTPLRKQLTPVLAQTRKSTVHVSALQPEVFEVKAFYGTRIHSQM